MKQVIVIRKDLKMRKGKMIAQGAHASMANLLNKKSKNTIIKFIEKIFNIIIIHHVNDIEREWIEGSFTKICVGVNSEEELLNIYEEAIKEKLNCNLIKDNGLTEFNNIKTNTCLAIGPDISEKINKITKKLKLL